MQQMHAWRVVMGVDDVSVAVLGVDISRMISRPWAVP
jgi:hypothetical protein